MLEEKIIDLKRELIGFATLIEQMIERCIKGLLEKKRDMLLDVLDDYEPKANNYEISIEEDCINLIAQFEPRAKDLRLILMGSKMCSSLERMGDHAVNIAESSLFLIERPPVKPFIDIPRMAEITLTMLRDTTTSFINEDSKLARNVCERDNLVDDLKDQLIRELVTYMTSDITTIERSLHLLRISGNLERIADLSTNICEGVIFATKGQVIKHHKMDNEVK